MQGQSAQTSQVPQDTEGGQVVDLVAVQVQDLEVDKLQQRLVHVVDLVEREVEPGESRRELEERVEDRRRFPGRLEGVVAQPHGRRDEALVATGLRHPAQPVLPRLLLGDVLLARELLEGEV